MTLQCVPPLQKFNAGHDTHMATVGHLEYVPAYAMIRQHTQQVEITRQTLSTFVHRYNSVTQRTELELCHTWRALGTSRRCGCGIKPYLTGNGCRHGIDTGKP